MFFYFCVTSNYPILFVVWSVDLWWYLIQYNPRGSVSILLTLIYLQNLVVIIRVVRSSVFRVILLSYWQGWINVAVWEIVCASYWLRVILKIIISVGERGGGELIPLFLVAGSTSPACQWYWLWSPRHPWWTFNNYIFPVSTDGSVHPGYRGF